MPNTSWIRLQATTRCLACSKITAVNAAIEELACSGCGADFTIRRELWDSALEDARTACADLDANATSSLELDAGGMTLVLAVGAVDARCPHCEVAWTSPPTRGACPKCDNAVSVRDFEVGSLVGEDAHMLAGERGEVAAQSVACNSCGAALSVDGTTRTVDCSFCSAQTVVPDEIWRRVHAADAVATWYLFTSGTRKVGLSQRLRPMCMAAGAGVVYMLGGYGDTWASIIALETDPLAVRWMVDLTALGKDRLTALTVLGDELYGYTMGTPFVEVFDTRSGELLRSINLAEPVMDLAPDPDGSFTSQTMTGFLSRFDAQGQPMPLWQGQGFFGRLFSGGAENRPPKKGTKKLFGNPRIGVGLDGDLRAISQRWIARFDRTGDVVWTAEVAKANGSVIAPAAAPDGTTWAVVRTVGGSMTLADMQAMTTAMMSGETQSTSALVRVGDNGEATVVRQSGADEYTVLAVTAEGEVWVGAEDELMRLDAAGELLWQQRRRG